MIAILGLTIMANPIPVHCRPDTPGAHRMALAARPMLDLASRIGMDVRLPYSRCGEELMFTSVLGHLEGAVRMASEVVVTDECIETKGLKRSFLRASRHARRHQYWSDFTDNVYDRIGRKRSDFLEHWPEYREQCKGFKRK